MLYPLDLVLLVIDATFSQVNNANPNTITTEDLTKQVKTADDYFNEG